MNLEASHPPVRKELRGATQNEKLIGRGQQEQGSCIRQKKQVGYCKVFSFRGGKCLSGRFPNYCWSDDSRWTGLRFHFCESQNYNSIRFKFGDVGLNVSDSLLFGPVLLFLPISHVYIGDTQRKEIALQESPSHQLKHHLPLKTKEKCWEREEGETSLEGYQESTLNKG